MEQMIEHSGLLAWHLRALAVLAFVLLAGAALGRSRAAVRHRLLAVGMLAAVIVPTVAAWLPGALAVEVATPTAVATAMPSLAQVATSPVDSATPVARAAASHSPTDWGSFALAVWTTGLVFGLLRVAFSAIGARSLIRGAGAPSDRVVDMHRALARKAGVVARIGVTPKVSVPIVAGFSSPTVLLPREANVWDDSRLRAVLSHELGHIAHGDHRWFPAMHVARALLWVNPLAWLAAAKFFRDAEFAADDAAVASGITASAYATELLALARIEVTPAPLLTVPALGRTEIGTRIRRVLASPTALASMRRVVPVLLGAVGATACLLVLRPALQEQEQIGELQTAAVPGRTGPQLPDLRGTHPVPANAARVVLVGDMAELIEQGAPVARQSLRADAPDRQGHHLQTLSEALEARDTQRPLLVQAADSVPYADVVDVMYSAGRAGMSSFRFVVNVGDEERVVALTPPRYRADAEQGQVQEGVTPLSVRVGWSEDGRSVVLLPKGEGLEGNACRTELRRPALARAIEAACEASNGQPVAVTFSPHAQTPFSDIPSVIAAMERSCGGATIIEAGADPLPEVGACGTDWVR